MKKTRLLIGVLVFLWALLLPQVERVQAAENENFKVEVTTDQQQEEFTYTITVTNLADTKATNVEATTKIPEGLEVTDSNVQVENNTIVSDLGTLAAAEQISVSFTAKKSTTQGGSTPPPTPEQPNDDPTKDSDGETPAQEDGEVTTTVDADQKTASPDTGDDTNFMFYIILFVVGASALGFAIWSLKSKRFKKDVAALIALAIVTAPLATKVKAETVKETIEETHEITIDDNTYEFVTTITAAYEVEQETPEKPEEPKEPETPAAFQIEGSWTADEANTLGYNLEWEAVENATAYKVLSSTDDTNYEEIASLESDANTYTDEVAPEVAVATYYQVVAIYEAEEITSNTVTSNTERDTDEDGLADYLELSLGTDPSKVDTDGDGLEDFYELDQAQTDPTVIDTDSNGVADGDEDLDADNLTNEQEQANQTNPSKADTDLDGLTDGEEVNTVGTNPIKYDTDNDNLSDGEEAPLGFDPTKQDTDGDGTIDGDEVVSYKTVPNKANEDEKVQPAVTIDSAASAGSSTTITSLDGDANLNEDIPGYIGPGYDFNTDVDFESAEMSFTYDESVVTEGFDPAIFYYNEEAQRLERLEGTHDPDTNTVTTTVNHFSKYILLNGTEWDKVWERDIRPPAIDEEGNVKNIDVVFSIDSSGSMWSNDPNDLRKQATKNFVDALREKDRSAVVDFDYSSRILINLTTDKEAVKMQIDTIDSSGGTDLYDGVTEAINELKNNSDDTKEKYIIFLTDGNGSWDDSAIQEALDNNIVIYTIGLGSSVDAELLERIATETGGKYYFASEADQLEAILDETAGDTVDYTKDEDEDLIPDYLEEQGLRTGLGKTFKNSDDDMDNDGSTNGSADKDSDGDGLDDGQEIEITYDTVNDKVYFTMYSDPLKKDSDGDGLEDGEEDKADRLSYNYSAKHSLMFSELSYTNMEGFLETNPNLAEIAEFSHDNADPNVDLDGWRLIKAVDNKDGLVQSGFSAIAARHATKDGDMIILAYRGSDNFEEFNNLFTDWIKTNADILVDGDNPQLDEAKEFAAEVILENPNSDIYVVGHSLGGFNAQVISHELQENTLDDIYCNCLWNNEKKKTINDALEDGNYQFTRTFNAAPFFGPRALDAIGIDMDTNTNPAIPEDTVWGNTYDSKVYNHQMSFDVLNVLGQYLDSEKLGKEVPEFDYKHDGAVLKAADVDFQVLVDIITAYEEEKGEIEASNRVELGRELYFLYRWITEQAESDPDFQAQLDTLASPADNLVHAHELTNFYPYLDKIQ